MATTYKVYSRKLPFCARLQRHSLCLFMISLHPRIHNPLGEVRLPSTVVCPLSKTPKGETCLTLLCDFTPLMFGSLLIYPDYF